VSATGRRPSGPRNRSRASELAHGGKLRLPGEAARIARDPAGPVRPKRDRPPSVIPACPPPTGVQAVRAAFRCASRSGTRNRVSVAVAQISCGGRPHRPRLAARGHGCDVGQQAIEPGGVRSRDEMSRLVHAHGRRRSHGTGYVDPALEVLGTEDIEGFHALVILRLREAGPRSRTTAQRAAAPFNLVAGAGFEPATFGL
jgi:hypothetical protein